ncbi:GntR family transcriptional regulator [Saccharicrinis fermentans]|uniref:HTH-type transcriptional repressor YvoA n=1 Tax=Saccharicrinis fermentans DSM 9555 = JCM 21142 TaxID=869213 RepID=W7YB22_9BACT|nr:GntR family transcriptional regulator [Saccharicrinis fermentans]GAF01561.1 HTH-type transcriptional repressor YvoA [Saccharicrinis fermentans DSM 9555 = JCM 21142]
MEKLKIDHSSSMPLHAQVEKLLRQLIEQPEYKKGGLLPKEVDLAKRLGISRNTLRQATNKLEYEGLLIRKKGVGTKVAEKGITTNLDNWLSFTQEMSDKGIEFKNYAMMAKWVDANDKIAAFFNIPKNQKVLYLSRLKGLDDCPFVYFESYFHPKIGLSIKEDFNRPLYDILENDYHVVPSFSKENIKACAVTKIIADKLEINVGDPILVRERYVSDPGMKPIEYNIGFYIAEKFTYSITIKR